MKKYIDMLGFKYRDRVTNYEGVGSTVSFDLYGCVQIALTPPAKKDKATGEQTSVDGRWFDASRLERVGKERVMDVPNYERFDLPIDAQPIKAAQHPAGPAEKPAPSR